MTHGVRHVYCKHIEIKPQDGGRQSWLSSIRIVFSKQKASVLLKTSEQYCYLALFPYRVYQQPVKMTISLPKFMDK